MAGRVRLAVTGVQDQWLSGEPQFSYFVMNYKRHTRFATESVEMPFSGEKKFGGYAELRIPNNVGDLVRSMMLKIKLKPLPSSSDPLVSNLYNTSLATNVIKYADLRIGGQTIERITGDYIYMYNQLHNNTDDLEQTMYFLTGHNNHLNVSTSYDTFYLNLPFYFFRHPSLAIPVCAITKQLVEVFIKFKDIDDNVSFKYTTAGDVVTRETTRDAEILDISMITDFFYITRAERNFLLTRPMEYVIQQLQMSTLPFKPGETEKSAMLKFKHPVKELMFLAKEETGPNNTIIAEDVVVRSHGDDFLRRGDDINGVQQYEKSGWSVALSSDGTRLVVGHPYYDYYFDDGGTAPGTYYDAGRVRVYEWNGTNWDQIGQDIIGPLLASPQFGKSVAITPDGSRIVVGAPNHRLVTGENPGLFRVYEWNATNSRWEQNGSDVIGQGDFKLGQSIDISLDGSHMSVGGAQGVNVYEWDVDNSEWVFRQLLLTANYGYCSTAISSDGSRIIVGIPRDTPVATPGAGRVRVYELDTATSEWSQIGPSINGAVNDNVGQSVDISSDGSRIVVGALGAPSRVYEWDAVNSEWDQLGQDISGVNSYERFGWSVAMSSDGSRIVIGGLYDKTYLDAARARVYDWDGNDWIQNGNDIFVSQTIAGEDDAGYAVAISSDGFTFAVGFPYDTLVEGTSVFYWVGKVAVYSDLIVTYTPGETIIEDRLLDVVSTDQTFSSRFQGKRSDHRLIKNIRFECNGEEVFNKSGLHAAYQESLEYHTGCPDPAYEFYMHSFALKPEEYYPSGQLNMSRIIHKKLDVELAEVSTSRNINVDIYAINYNVLRVESGLAGLKF